MPTIASRMAKSLARQAAQLVASQPVNKTNKYYQALYALDRAFVATNEDQISVYEGVQISFDGRFYVANETVGNLRRSASLLEEYAKGLSIEARALIRACPGTALRRVATNPDIQEIGYPTFRDERSPRIAVWTAARPGKRLYYMKSDYDYPGTHVLLEEAKKLLCKSTQTLRVAHSHRWRSSARPKKESLMRVAGPRARIVQFWRPGRSWWVKVDGYDGAIKVVESQSGMLTTFGKHPSRATWPALQVVKAYRKAGYPQIPSHGEWPKP